MRGGSEREGVRGREGEGRWGEREGEGRKGGDGGEGGR